MRPPNGRGLAGSQPVPDPARASPPQSGPSPTAEAGHARSGTALAVSIILLVAVAICDYLVGPKLSLSSLYLIPIFVATWRVTRRAGIAMSLVAYAVWTGVNLDVPWENASRAYVYWEGFIKLSTALVFVMLLSKLRQSLATEARLARTDFLTGLANRTAFYEKVDLEMARCRRFGHKLSIAYIDLDDFKQLNDRFGHRVGDDALKLIAGAMTATLRSTDVAARLGGDEFAVLLPESGGEAAERAIGKLHSQLLKPMRERGWPVTFSIGVATFATIPGSVDDMIRRADGLMYHVKKEGKGNVRAEVFS